MSILIFLGVLFALVLVHELGHFAVAKWTGMRVDEFGIGFPPRLFGVRKGETEYTLNLFPIGGFVRIFGENGDEAGGEVNDDGASSVPSDGGRSFTDKSRWAQAAVLVAGITMNILFAWLLISAAFAMGVETSVEESEAGPSARLVVLNVLPESPAASALDAGDVIEGASAGGESIESPTPSAFSEFIGRHGDEAVTLAYRRGSERGIAEVTPKAGVVSAEASRPAIGVSLSMVEKERRSAGAAIVDGFTYTFTSLKETALGIGGLLYDAIRGRADLSQVAGPVGIVGLVGQASAYGLSALLMFTAFISLNLAVINILPFPALDGGRLLFVAIESVKGSPIPARYAGIVNAIGFVLLIALMVVITVHDVSRLI